MIASVGTNVLSQLYQSLTSSKAQADDSGSQPPGGQPAAASAPGSSAGSDPISAASAKIVTDLKSLLLGLQTDGTASASTPAAASSGATAAASTATGGTNGQDPLGQLTSDLSTLLGDLKKAGHHHHHGGGHPPGGGGDAPANGDTGVQPSGTPSNGTALPA